MRKELIRECIRSTTFDNVQCSYLWNSRKKKSFFFPVRFLSLPVSLRPNYRMLLVSWYLCCGVVIQRLSPWNLWPPRWARFWKVWIECENEWEFMLIIVLQLISFLICLFSNVPDFATIHNSMSDCWIARMPSRFAKISVTRESVRFGSVQFSALHYIAVVWFSMAWHGTLRCGIVLCCFMENHTTEHSFLCIRI